MESRESTLLHLIGLITTKGKDFNELKLQKLVKIAEQPGIDLEANDENQLVTATQAPDATPAAQGTKRPAIVPLDDAR